MKIRRYAAVALAIVIVALIIRHATGEKKTSEETDLPSSRTSQDFSSTQSHRKNPAASAKRSASNGAVAVNTSISDGAELQKKLASSDTELTTNARPATTPTKPAVSASSYLVQPPVTFASPPPLELYRTNAPEIPPGANRNSSSP